MSAAHTNTGAKGTNCIESLPKNACHPLHLLESFLQQHQSDVTSPTVPSPANHTDNVLRMSEYLFGSAQVNAALNLLDTSDTFTKLSSPHRSVWLVQASTGAGEYFCLCPTENDSITPSLYYCNCRSYYEKNIRQGTSSHGKMEPSGPTELCKHLLAIQLLPILEVPCTQQSVSDLDLAQMVLDRTMGPADDSLPAFPASSSNKSCTNSSSRRSF